MRMWRIGVYILLTLVTGSVGFFVDAPLGYVFQDAGLPPSDYTIHDPSRVITFNQKQMIASTGRAQEDGYDCGLETWSREEAFGQWVPGQCLFRAGDKPHWIKNNIRTQGGAFWAPELINATAMYYSVASWNDTSPVTCVGLATATGEFPNRLAWKDSGAPVVCANKEDFGVEVSAIDPTFIRTTGGRAFLVTGGGLIHGIEVNKDTLLPKRRSWLSPYVEEWKALASGPDREDDNWVEASYVHQRGEWFYLFVNWGLCCSGVESTYEIRVGRSKSALGPYVDKGGVDMLDGGGTLLATAEEFLIGPGHLGIWKSNSREDIMTFHYYDSRRDGAPWVGERKLWWADGWPNIGEIKSVFDMQDNEE